MYKVTMAVCAFIISLSSVTVLADNTYDGTWSCHYSSTINGGVSTDESVCLCLDANGDIIDGYRKEEYHNSFQEAVDYIYETNGKSCGNVILRSRTIDVDPGPGDDPAYDL